MSDLPTPIEWRRGALRVLDQRALPNRVTFLDCRSVDALCDAIATLAIRGAPALGAAGAYGVALAAALSPDSTSVHAAAGRIASTRPTAVNLAWGVERALVAFRDGGPEAALRAAEDLVRDDIAGNEAIGRHGLSVLPSVVGGARVLTHCNAGHLATAGFGTAIGVIRAGYANGLVAQVWVDETRPLLQGARLTAWELGVLGIPHTLLIDSAAASLMQRGDVDVVVVGADRIAANGDTANKIGTYSLAVLAHAHKIPFVVAAPVSTIDLQTRSGRDIVVEDRADDEVTVLRGARLAPEGVAVYNPAFDVTPARLISAIVTDRGVVRRPFDRSVPAIAR